MHVVCDDDPDVLHGHLHATAVVATDLDRVAVPEVHGDPSHSLSEAGKRELDPSLQVLLHRAGQNNIGHLDMQVHHFLQRGVVTTTSL
jgi:hypothetical protein